MSSAVESEDGEETQDDGSLASGATHGAEPVTDVLDVLVGVDTTEEEGESRKGVALEKQIRLFFEMSTPFFKVQRYMMYALACSSAPSRTMYQV